jgi:DNA-binding HxlR family transcriptional regulator
VPDEFGQAADLLERRWLLAVLWAAHNGARRYGEFQQSIGRVPPRTLAQRLSELEAAGVLRRVPVAPSRHEYRLTPAGELLGALLREVERWAASCPPDRC